MLGKRPCLLRTTSSQSLPIPCEDTEGEPATSGNYAQVTEKIPRPALSAPCKIVIGFDIGAEKKPLSDACESPRSVLDTLVLLSSQEKQQVVARSPRSGLGSLLLAVKSGSGAGLEVVAAQNQDKEMSVHVDSVAGSLKATFHVQNCSDETYPDITGWSSKSSHVHCKDIGWFAKGSDCDFMDADIPSWQRQAPCVLSVEDDPLDTDIAPRRSRALFPPSSQNMNANFIDINISPYQSRAFDACLSCGLKGGCFDADTFAKCSRAPWRIGLPYVTCSNVPAYKHTDFEVPTWQSGPSSGHGNVGASACINDHIPTWQSEAQSLWEECTDTHSTPWQRQALHHMSSYMESEEISTQRSIFSASSPPCMHSLNASSSGFLKVCAFCGRSLRLGKDIFMYRGDQAFCSAECRYQKIVLDEREEIQGN